MVHHIQNLGFSDQAREEPNAYVKVYLKPDPTKQTKRKTKVVKKNCNPSFMEVNLTIGNLCSLLSTHYQFTVSSTNVDILMYSCHLLSPVCSPPQMLEYRVPLHTVQSRTLHASVWDSSQFQENMFLGKNCLNLLMLPSLCPTLSPQALCPSPWPVLTWRLGWRPGTVWDSSQGSRRRPSLGQKSRI